MIRRTFLKRVGQAIAGSLALPLFSKKAKADELVTANGMDEVQSFFLSEEGKLYYFNELNNKIVELPTGKNGQYLGYDLKWHNPGEMPK